MFHPCPSSVTSHMVSDLCTEGDRPTGLVLESPFNNIQDEVKLHKLASVSHGYIQWEWT